MPRSLSPLPQKGLVQGCLLDCSNQHLSVETKKAIQDGRAVALSRQQPINKEHLLLILSQDCDILNAEDKFIEVLPIKKVPSKRVASQQQDNRNYRKLQLPINGEFWLLEAKLISIIPRKNIEREKFKVITTLNQRNKGILIDWRVSRYNRNPFPDKFHREFKNYLNNSKYRFGEYLKNHYNNIIDLFIYVTPRDEEQAEEYRVSITALIDEACPSDMQKEIEKTLHEHCETLHKLKNSLKMTQIDTSCRPEIQITQDLVLKQSDFTMLDAKNLSRITLDYLCYA